MKFIDLFAGIGGFHLGMEQAGHECVGWVEWDKFARKSYQAIHDVKGVWNASDIRTVRSTEIPRADCWCFGFPCQDISVAGKQRGITDGKRSSLFFTVTQLIRNTPEKDRPSYLFIENVKNLLSINRGFDFLKLQIELDEIGYDVEWDVLDSAQVVPQHRERIFIVGHLRGRRTRKVFPIIRESGEANKTDKAVIQIGNISNSKSFGGNPQVGRVYGIDGIAPTLSTMQGGGQEPKALISKKQFGRLEQQAINTFNDNKSNILPGDVIDPYNHRLRKDGKTPTVTTRPEGLKTCILPITTDFRIRKLTPLECWRLQGFPDWAFDRAKAAGLSDSQLYKQAGNSVTVPVIKAITDRLEVPECMQPYHSRHVQ